MSSVDFLKNHPSPWLQSLFNVVRSIPKQNKQQGHHRWVNAGVTVNDMHSHIYLRYGRLHIMPSTCINYMLGRSCFSRL